MSSIGHIRKNIFRVSQTEMARIAGVSQATISRWENGVSPSQDDMARIRSEALNRDIPWNDRWFFEVEAAE